MRCNGDAPEEMAAFFNRRAEGYDAHMRATVEDFDAFYAAVASAVECTDAPVRVLDLGAGTGAELEGIFSRAPHAQVTAVDVSQAMLDQLKRRHAAHSHQMQLICASFTDIPLSPKAYDYVVSVMALHHHLPAGKLRLYRKIYGALLPGGTFVNGDYITDEQTRLDEPQRQALAENDQHPEGGYHVDFPLPLDEEVRLLGQTGFVKTRVLLRSPRAAVFVALRSC